MRSSTLTLLRAGVPALLIGLLAAPGAIRTFAQVNSNPGVEFGVNTQFADPLNQEEPSVAFDPRNPNIVVAVYQGHFAAGDARSCVFQHSTDGGNTWTSGGRAPLVNPGDSCGDPVVAADVDGNFYFSYLNYDLTKRVVPTRVVVAKSTDGGRTFPTLSIARDAAPRRGGPDKDMIAVDTGSTSPYRGRIYAAYSVFVPRGIVIESVTSLDGGVTWSRPIVLAEVAPTPREPRDTVERFGALPVIASDGTVFVFWSEFPEFPHPGPTQIRFSKSIDGGATWTDPSDVAVNLPSPGFFDLKNANPAFGTDPFVGMIGNSMPVAGVAADGTLSVAWVDFPEGSCVRFSFGGPECTNSDVRLSQSRDGGATWTPPVKVSDETNATDQFLPWMAVHPSGLVSLIWRDKRLDADNINIDTYYTNTYDGVSFLPNVRVSTAPSISGANTRNGDYVGLAATNDRVFAVWTDSRFGDLDVFAATGRLPP
jgi:hypothetical protein